MRPKDSYASGHLVKSFDNPETTPITLADGSSVILLPNGEYLFEERKANGW